MAAVCARLRWQDAHVAGELNSYVVNELNVRSVVTCSQPMQYSTVRAVPQWQVRHLLCAYLHGFVHCSVTNTAQASQQLFVDRRNTAPSQPCVSNGLLMQWLSSSLAATPLCCAHQ